MIKTAGKLWGKLKAQFSIFSTEGTNNGTILQHHVLNFILGTVSDDGDYDGDVGDDIYDGNVNYDYDQDYEC